MKSRENRYLCMDMKVFRIITATVLLLFATALSGREFRRLDTFGSPVGHKVYQAEQDAAGFLWFYTQTGVFRYDGSQFRRYEIASSIQSRDKVQSGSKMETDREGVLWISLRNGLLFRFDSEQDRFVEVLDIASLNAGSLLYGFAFDENGRLWLGTDIGAFLYSEGKAELVAAGGVRVNTILPMPGGEVNLGTERGVFRLAGPQAPAVPVSDSGLDVLTLFDWDGQILAGTFSSGLVFLDGTVVLETQSPVRTILRYEDALVVAMDGDGLYWLDPSTFQPTAHFLAEADREDGIAANTVTDLCVDHDQTLWVVSSTGGICHTVDPAQQAERIRHLPGDPGSLASDHVNVVLEDATGNLWFGTDSGVDRMDARTGLCTHFLPTPDVSAAVVLALAEDGDGTIWAGGYGIPVFQIDRSGRVRLWKDRALNHVYALHFDGKCLWMGGMDGSLIRYNPRSGEVTEFPGLLVGDIADGGDGTLLLATTDGWGTVDTSDGSYRLSDRIGDLRLEYPVRSIDRGKDGTIWLATDGQGLIGSSPDGRLRERYSTNEGLSYNSINCVLADREGRIWLTTEGQIYCIREGRLVNVNGFLDFDCGYFNPGAACVLSDGSLLFGTAAGAVRFHPDFIDQDFSPSVLPILTDLTLLEDGSVLRIPGSGREIRLKARQNAFSIGYSALSFEKRYRLRLEYLLEGYSSEWTGTEGAGTVVFRYVPSGKYTFRLRVVDRYSGTVLGETQAPIRIARPWWLSGWAFLLYGLLLFAAIFQLVLLQRRKEAEEMAREKVDHFISFAHDIKTPVTLIKAPLSELGNVESLSPESRENLAVARRNTERLMSMINNLLELKDVTPERFGLELTPCNLSSYIESHLDEYYPSAREKGIALEQEVGDGLEAVLTDVPRMDMILDNLLSNALKYTETGKITVRAHRNGRRWELEIEDTGIGIPAEARKYIFQEVFRADNARETDGSGYGMGLMITRQLVRRLHGSIRYEDIPQGGTRFILSFPLRYRFGKKIHLAETPPEEVPPESLENVLSSGKETILIAEDDRDMLEYLSSSLGQQYNVLMAENGMAASALADEYNPDIVITDVVMPQLTGDELCRRLKGRLETSHIPVILLTAMGEKENIIFGLEAGADDYIVKPFDMAILRARIRNLLHRRSQLQTAIVTENMDSSSSEFVNPLDKAFIEKVRSVIESRLSDPEFQVNDLCSELAMSRTAFFNKLKSLTGGGPNDYIRIFRLNRARELLLSRKYTVAEVSDMVGFSDPKYFSVCFRKQFDISPSRI